MKLSDFDYPFSEDLIAMQPASPKDSAKMLVLDNSKINDHYISDLPDFLTAKDLLIFNDTKVIPAKLSAYKSGLDTIININLHKNLQDSVWSSFVKPGKKIKIGDILHIADQQVEVLNKLEDGQVILDFKLTQTEFADFINLHGQTPLPPYIEKNHLTTKLDKILYQTIFARHAGSVAAPTAGLHFTEGLMAKLAAKGIQHDFVTLHVGGGTFLPVKTENLSEHKMHSELCQISEKTAKRINQTKQNGGRIIAVGTTSTRTLETCSDTNGIIKAFYGEIDLFITPGYKFKLVDMMLTNFHLPKSTLLMLIAAFSGYDEVFAAYAHARKSGYRFYSYGDCCLLHHHHHQTQDHPRAQSCHPRVGGDPTLNKKPI